MTERKSLDETTGNTPIDAANAGARIIESDAILKGDRTVEILHGGSTYRLIRTKNDKLILTK